MSDDPVTPAPDSDDEQPGHGVAESELADGAVRRVGPWAVGLSGGVPFATSARCRHQLADLTKGTVDAGGCLVCPWHGARYDVRDGRMVDGPRGFLTYHGPTRGYRDLVRAYARFLPLRRARAVLRGARVEVDDSRTSG